MTELHYDVEATKRPLAAYVTPDVVAQREQFLRALGTRPGERGEYFFSLNRYLFPARRIWSDAG